MATCLAKEWKIALQDEEGRRLAGAQVEAVLTPPDDPRLSSTITRTGQTDADGGFRFIAEDRMVLARVRAKRPGHHSADMDHRHGLGRPSASGERTLTLPHVTELVPLNYREVSLSGLPTGKRIGFDAEVADAIAPWGKGKVADFDFQIESEQVGWTESAEALAILRRTGEGARLDDREWAEAYGRFRGRLHLSFSHPGDGLRETPSFWPYCLLKMPALAPQEGYAGEKTILFDTLPIAESAHDFTGTYLRLRTQLAADGRIISAHYAKIHGQIITGPGRVTFRFYYNPRVDDRRLALAPGRNLLRPGPGEPVHRFETQQP
jgi:hypothetical protein